MTKTTEIELRDLMKLTSALATIIGYTKGAGGISLSLSDDPADYIQRHGAGLKEASTKADISLRQFMAKYFPKEACDE